MKDIRKISNNLLIQWQKKLQKEHKRNPNFLVTDYLRDVPFSADEIGKEMIRRMETGDHADKWESN